MAEDTFMEPADPHPHVQSESALTEQGVGETRRMKNALVMGSTAVMSNDTLPVAFTSVVVLKVAATLAAGAPERPPSTGPHFAKAVWLSTSLRATL